MKKVFIMAYARKNLGDDLFIKMLLEKYTNIEFFIKIRDYEFLKDLDKYENLNVLTGNDTDEELYNMDVHEYDGYVYIGGSIFMEGGQVYNLSPKFYDFVNRCKQENIPFCYISCNYGPYQTQEYFELSRNNFEACTDICFRDKYSYNLFKDIESVRYAPDYAFSYNMEKQEKIQNTVGISVINLSIRNDEKHLEEQYIQFLVNNIKKYIEQGKKVYLYSFCEHEKDEITIEKVLKEFKDNANVVGVKYDGDIDKFLELYSKMEYMICARFHAMILSSIFMQKIYVMSYSKKIDRVIEDLDLDFPILHIKELKEDDVLALEVFKSVDSEKIQNISKEAEKQDEAIRKHII